MCERLLDLDELDDLLEEEDSYGEDLGRDLLLEVFKDMRGSSSRRLFVVGSSVKKRLFRLCDRWTPKESPVKLEHADSERFLSVVHQLITNFGEMQILDEETPDPDLEFYFCESPPDQGKKLARRIIQFTAGDQSRVLEEVVDYSLDKKNSEADSLMDQDSILALVAELQARS